MSRWLLTFFFVSGFCSLVYEVVWVRLAVARFGTTTPSVSLVLSVFMAGLALGSWAGGRLARRLERRGSATFLALYGAAELVIAVSGLAVPGQLDWGRRLLLGMGRGTAWESWSHHAASGLWIAVTLLPYCAAMGATFPLAMAALRGARDGGGPRSFSRLYVANVLGATAGTLTAAFVLVELLGFKGTLRLSAALNTLLGATALALTRAAPAAGGARAAPPEAAIPAPEALPAEPLALPALFATGLISMAMEVVWVRQFTPYLGTVVYAFATILAVYLGATFLGSAMYRRWGAIGTGWVWLGIGLAAVLPLLTADYRIPLPEGPAGTPFVMPRLRLGVTSGALRVALGLAPFCAATGWLTPMLVDRWSRGDPRRAGKAYAVNVVGCILGPLLAGFGLLPYLGERGSVVLLSLPLFALGALAALGPGGLAPAGGATPARRRLVAAGVAAASLAVMLLARDYATRFPGAVVRRDYEATVIATGTGMERQLLVNGTGITGLTPITKLMVHFPLVLRPAPPRDALVICFGMGTSFRSALSWGIPTTAVELVPSVPSLFDYFHMDGRQLLQSPLSRVVVDDGRRFLERSRASYDLITIDPPPPVEAATSSLLYSREFYDLVRSRLRPGGVVQQWLPSGDPTVVTSFTRALTESFPHVRAFLSIADWGLHFVASTAPLPEAGAAELAARLPAAAALDLAEWSGGAPAERIFRKMLENEADIGQLLDLDPEAPALTDDRPLNEYYLLRRLPGRGRS